MAGGPRVTWLLIFAAGFVLAYLLLAAAFVLLFKRAGWELQEFDRD